MSEKRSGMVVHSEQDMKIVWDFINSLQVNGIAAARQVASVGTILESGKPLEEYMERKEAGTDG